MTQAELARASGLSPATVSSIAHELRDEEWVIDEDLEGARGRALTLSRDAGLAVGIAFGHSHVRVAIAVNCHSTRGSHDIRARKTLETRFFYVDAVLCG